MHRDIAYTDGMVEMTDYGVGETLRTLGKCNCSDYTNVIFASDHGELLSDHGLLPKELPSYRQLTEVLLLMQGPNIGKEHSTSTLTNHIALARAILELAGINQGKVGFDRHKSKANMVGHG